MGEFLKNFLLFGRSVDGDLSTVHPIRRLSTIVVLGVGPPTSSPYSGEDGEGINVQPPSYFCKEGRTSPSYTKESLDGTVRNYRISSSTGADSFCQSSCRRELRR